MLGQLSLRLINLMITVDSDNMHSSLIYVLKTITNPL